MNILLCHRLKNTRAFTMVELMGAVTIALVLIIMLYSIFDKVQKVFITGQNRAIAMDESRSAMDILVEDFQGLSRVGTVIGTEPNLRWVPEYLIDRNPVTSAFVYLPPNPGAPFDETLIDKPFKNTREAAGGVRVGENATLRMEPDGFVNYSGVPAAPSEFPSGSSLELFHHNCRFFTEDANGWRLVHYKFGTRERYFTPISDPLGITSVDLIDSPVGALWIYRSPPSSKAGLMNHIPEHEDFQSIERPPIWDKLKTWPKGSMVLFHEDKNYYMARKLVDPHDPDHKPWGDPRDDMGNWAKLNSGGIDAPMGFSRLIDGVIHFRVRAADPNNFDRGMDEYTPSKNPFVGNRLPTHVSVEIAVLDRKLLKEVENGMEQDLEALQLSAAEESYVTGTYLPHQQKYQREVRLASERCRQRIEKINENLDRVYFFKQLIRIRN